MTLATIHVLRPAPPWRRPVARLTQCGRLAGELPHVVDLEQLDADLERDRQLRPEARRFVVSRSSWSVVDRHGNGDSSTYCTQCVTRVGVSPRRLSRPGARSTVASTPAEIAAALAPDLDRPNTGTGRRSASGRLPSATVHRDYVEAELAALAELARRHADTFDELVDAELALRGLDRLFGP